ncbi:MAG: hypothetical protein LBQ63_01460 [Deltaproteobacteria bacterium]|jgi:hypothetical protein|nr:hypothetical protein [Deltaproteobacteria bacterium]
MAEIVNFNAQIAPLEHVEKVARREQEHGHVAGQGLLRDAARLLGRDNEQVQKTGQGEGQRVERRRDEEDRGGSGAFSGHQEQAEGEENPEDAASPSSSNIWSGNIVNLKV